MLSPNILITNYCNQDCSYCFARAEKSNFSIDREMTLENFHRILRKMRKIKIDTVKLLGGEPMLHPHLEEIIDLSLSYFQYLQIFTNGIISGETAEFVKKYFPRIRFTFNVMTPDFQANKEVRDLVLKRIKDFTFHTKVAISFTVGRYTDITSNFKMLPRHLFKSIYGVRIGVANPIAKAGNYYKFSSFPKIGQQIYRLTKLIRGTRSKAHIHLSCGFTRCMFTGKQLEYFRKQKIEFSGWGCFGKQGSIDIATNMTAFHCFPLSTLCRLKIQNKSLTRLYKDFLGERYVFLKNIYFQRCEKCSHHGYKAKKCPGPCIAFSINRLTVNAI